MVFLHPPLSITRWFNLRERLRQDFQVFKKPATISVEEFQCFQMDQEPLSDYLRRFVQKKAQTPNFSEKAAIEKCTPGLLPSQLASHLSREPPRTLAELYTKVEKYARSDADHRIRVE